MAERFIINNFNLGGLAESAYQGKPNSLAEIVGCDIHSEPGILKASRALELAPTQSPITGMPRAGKGLVASDNSVYFFTKDDSYPRIWKEDSPTWTTYAPSDLLAVQDAAEYRGFIFFTHTAKLGYFEVGTSPGGATIDWQTGMSSSHKPMLVKTGKLWIGNGNLLQQVTTSSNPATSINDYDAPATELTFEAYETITAIGEIGSDLLVATTLPYGCKIRRIDT
ncbi:MAG: hypothetical protein GY861_18355, partial [bacterium]|nr:hypothetical protein [bacterium]